MSNMDEEQNVPEPVIHISDNYVTAYYGKLPETVLGEKSTANDQKLISNFIALLIDPAHRDLKSDVLAILRNSKATQFLVDLISMKEYAKNRKELVMACWECGLDFTAYLELFVNIAVESEYAVALEAYTVIDEMHGTFDDLQRSNSLRMLGDFQGSSDKQSLIKIIADRIQV
jgi:hypothetical protein